MASMALVPSTSGMLTAMIHNQFLFKPKAPPAETCFAGETIIITGANSGLGLATVDAVLRNHASHVILASRSLQRGDDAAAPLRRLYPKAKLEVWQLDMLSYESIEDFARRCGDLERLDRVILNAGVAMSDFVINQSTGHETTFQVNYLSTALLSLLLLPVLRCKRRKNSSGRLLIVASGLSVRSKFENRQASPLIPSFDDAEGWNSAAAVERYSCTKTLVLMLVQKLSEAIDPNEIIVNCVEPGLVKGTGLSQHSTGLVKYILSFMNLIAGRTTEQGAWSYIDAVASHGKESHGGLVWNSGIHPFHPMMYNGDGKQTMDRLWEETLKELEFVNARSIIATMQKIP